MVQIHRPTNTLGSVPLLESSFYALKREAAPGVDGMLKEELLRRRHLPVAELGEWLRSVVQAHFNDHAVPGNMASLRSFRKQVIRRWMRALRRRSQKHRITLALSRRSGGRWLPRPTILHPYPNVRFDATHQR